MNIGNVTFGIVLCFRMDEVFILEFLVVKKVVNERLIVLLFREDCIVMVCYEGFIRIWVRLGKVVSVICAVIIFFIVFVFFRLKVICIY